MKSVVKFPTASTAESKEQIAEKIPGKKIKVVHILDLVIDCYIWKNLYAYTNAEQAELVFVNFNSEESDFFKGMKKRGVKVYALNAISKKQYPKALIQLFRIIRNEKPDVIHTHLFFPTLIGITVAKILGLKMVVTRHHTDAHHVLKSNLKRRFYLGLENYINTSANHLIALSRLGKEILIEKENVPPDKVSLIPNGQTFERFENLSEEIIQNKRLKLGMDKQLSIVCTSRLFHGKGHIYLFEALAPLIKNGLQAKLFLVGQGEYRQTLEKKVEELGIEKNVEFLGWRSDALEIAAAADLIIHPSLEDALSSAVIEALMLSRPIIASDISGMRDILDDGKYGIIVPPADSAALRQAIEKIIPNLEAAKINAKKGRQHILTNMGAEQFADGYVNCYKKILTSDK